MKPAPFEYCRADTLDEALDLMAEFGSDAAVLAGGMSLGPMLNMRLARPAAIVDVNLIENLSGIRLLDDALETGALCRQADALDSALVRDEVPLLSQALPFVGHFQTRNRGTLGGSVCHADPSAEIPLALAALGGDVILRQRGGMRAVAATDFFDGIFTTVREPDELVTALRWPRSNPKTGYAFDEIAQRHGDFAIGAAAAVATVAPDGNLAALSLGLGGIEDRPVLADLAGFVGAPATVRTASEAAALAADRADPMEDPKASAAYRRQLVRVLGARVLERAFERAGARQC
ncbi:MAG: hypothetical protein F4160_05575 [Rhodospirillaceae bacterium]|nr:hypothetical protein [Rhodospirillaceae bacterium]MYF85721.1 hypothetical protein [Rhodospirillaceae bacterium]MYH36251.1 hypothetical protein [Rhodospirillaceae bacterium]MYK15255.1 hypothetical protein [Rhodospirillaceae bacterium]